MNKAGLSRLVCSKSFIRRKTIMQIPHVMLKCQNLFNRTPAKQPQPLSDFQLHNLVSMQP